MIFDHQDLGDAAIGELCKRPDGQYVSFKGHLGVHLARLPKKLLKGFC